MIILILIVRSVAGVKVRRPWPLLTNAGKSEEQIQREQRELEELLEKIRDNRARDKSG